RGGEGGGGVRREAGGVPPRPRPVPGGAFSVRGGRGVLPQGGPTAADAPRPAGGGRAAHVPARRGGRGPRPARRGTEGRPVRRTAGRRGPGDRPRGHLRDGRDAALRAEVRQGGQGA